MSWKTPPHSATHDALTGLLNRAAFESRLDEACRQAREDGREHALCFIDLDRFKLVNDGAGQAAGDTLLKEAAGAIRRGCRAQDIAARIGGDEFALLAVDCPVATARVFAAKIVQAIASLQFTWEGTQYAIGASVGVTAVDARTSTRAVLLEEADTACYTAKDRGRNQVVVFDRGQADRSAAAIVPLVAG